MERRLAAILAADVVGYSRLMGEDEAGTLTSLRSHRQDLIDPVITNHHGNVVKLMGDGMLVEFPSVVEAVRCAVEVQLAMAKRNTAIPEARRISFRVGINIGDVIVEDKDIHGDGVNVAARLEGLAKPGGICLSDFAHDQVHGRVDQRFLDGGHRRLKNIARPIRVWHWAPDGSSAHDIQEDFSSGLALPDKPSIAVLPFRNLSSDEEQGFLADGMTEDIIAALSRIRWLFVIARNSTFAFQGRRVVTKTVAAELGVRYVLEGSVRRAGHRVRIAAQLTEPETAKQLWGDHYDGTVEEIFDFQDQVTHQIVSTLQPSLLDAEADRSQRQRPDDLNCWDCVVRARPHIWTWDEDRCGIAKSLLQQAIEIDPNYGLARSMLAMTQILGAWMGWSPDPSHAVAIALSESQRAIQLDPSDAWAHIALGLSYGLQRKNTEAISELRKALDLDPNSTLAHVMLGTVLVWGGYGDGGIAEFDQALRSNPRDPFNRILGGMYSAAHFVAGRYDESMVAAQETVRKLPRAAGPIRILAAACANCGQEVEARAAFEALREIQANISASWVRTYFPWTEGDHLDRFVDALQRAGMPD